MGTISVLMEANVINRFKAPKGFMYDISGIHGTILSSGNNEINIVDYLVEDERGNIGTGEGSETIATISPLIAGTHININFMDPQRTKYFTIATASSTSFRAAVIVVFELVKAKRIDLMIEWFRKGR